MILSLVSAVALAQVGKSRDRESPSDTGQARDRDRDRGDQSRDRSGRAATPEQGAEEATEEGMPRAQAVPAPGQEGRSRIVAPRWRLGVYAVNTRTGVRITQVMPGTAAANQGLEPGDRIVSVDGYQVGYVRGRLYPLGDELQRRAGPRGNVLLLVQNVRTQELQNMEVTLDRYPIERAFRDRERR